jgi:hypothetical protein
MSCVPTVASFSGLFVFALCLVYPMLTVSLDCLSSPYVLCTQCYQFLWIVCLRLMSCVPNVASFSGLFVFALCLVYLMLTVSLDCLSSRQTKQRTLYRKLKRRTTRTPPKTGGELRFPRRVSSSKAGTLYF